MNIEALFSVKGKVVLVTGGSRGIGEMIATGFVQGGARVYISSRSSKACDEVAAKLTALGPGECISLPGDLQNLADLKGLVAELTKRETHLDVLVNNAGATWGAPIDSYPDAAFQKIMNLNVTRIFTLTQACLPLLRANASADSPSSVINIGSINGESVPGMETYAYSSSKAAVHHLTRHLASTLGKEHILVNAVAPGSFPSKMMAATLRDFGDEIIAKVPVGRVGTPEDVAGTCIYLASRAGQYTCGSVIVVDGGALHSSSKI
ncbi:hypothetical protein J3Q64DRAFT_1765265 [Phycomyces blakesleeanus]|uniref:Uncharacterized protein n=2 Tax=Phycomyces blakesleeanus TaxID=4837 RepID=A0A162UFD1_PHYB8|nr:hypothetical protein PHYBLDRAFT_124113 [Phycomyces blakesleeanus NRRL 1555(-)]OAD74733.1 hypothetical protein PHYBLDRAFT_124113 [Phycomyces blakesleeanus NRRL 1555(-)]|eukprot:XP_018292773.1 hypothetical protein PHYBLDRAFT_124113 [Phycomyces blakesleeanus NRRL 1555(-)]